jgi:hypothetical protein
MTLNFSVLLASYVTDYETAALKHYKYIPRLHINGVLDHISIQLQEARMDSDLVFLIDFK